MDIMTLEQIYVVLAIIPAQPVLEEVLTAVWVAIQVGIDICLGVSAYVPFSIMNLVYLSVVHAITPA